MTSKALIIVDMQYDFIDGALACKGAADAVANTVAYIRKMTASSDADEDAISDSIPVLFTGDCHPADHMSFTVNGGTWPVHCVKGTPGAGIHSDLVPFLSEELMFRKGCDPTVEQYSAFLACNGAGQSMHEVLQLLDTTDVYVCGIATEFCVRQTSTDLIEAGLKVHVMENCLAYVDENGHRQALSEMAGKGIRIERA